MVLFLFFLAGMIEKVYFCIVIASTMEEKQQELRRLVEQVMGMLIQTPSDFELLMSQIYQKTGQRLSMSTIKRFWGYVDKENADYRVRVTTLDILSEFCGYQNWATFCQADVGGEEESGDMVNRHLFAKDLVSGDLVRLQWKPDRIVTIRFEGSDLFTVVESINSKLRPGDTFHCLHIVDGMPLTLFGLVRDGRIVGNYVCGKIHGVSFSRK